MNKKMILAATAAILAVPAAWAESGNVSMYGVVNASFDAINNGSAGITKVSSNASRIGFKGTEDISGGLKAVWQIETQVNLDGTAADTWATRNTFVGLNGDSFGTVLLGRYDTPYKISTRKLDMFPDSIADNRSLMGSVKGVSSYAAAFDQRPTDTVAWSSPVLNGVTVSAAYIAGAETSAAASDNRGSAWSLAAWYDAAPFYGTLAYEVHDVGSTGTGTLAGTSNVATAYGHAGAKESAFKLGAGYKVGAFNFSLAYEKTTDNVGGTGIPAAVLASAPGLTGGTGTVVGADVFGHNAWYLAGKYAIDKDAVKLAYTRVGDLAGTAAGKDTHASQTSVGYDHTLSKRTMLYALYTKLSNGTDIRYTLGSAGFSSGLTAASAAGADVSAWSLGVKHSF